MFIIGLKGNKIGFENICDCVFKIFWVDFVLMYVFNEFILYFIVLVKFLKCDKVIIL